jgi:hypothetical protein
MAPSKRFDRTCPFFVKLCRTKSKKMREEMLQNAPDFVVAACVELVFNTLKERLNLTKQQKSSLRKHIDALRKVAKLRKTDIARDEIIQTGGAVYLPILLAPILSELISRLL